MQIISVKGINAMGKTSGCEKAPIEILESMEDIYSNEKGKIVERKLLNVSELKIDNNNVEEANKLIYNNSRKLFLKQDNVIFLGGDHSISYSLVKGFADNYKEPFLIVFDAHADCMTPGKEPTHEEWLRKLVEEGFNSKNVVIVAARNIHPEERAFLDRNKIRVYGMKQIFEDIEGICDAIMESARNSDAFYISIDIDSIDPAFAPGTGYLEPGGLASRELLYFLQRLLLLKNFKGADIVEINPDRDETGRTIKLGAKILSELI